MAWPGISSVRGRSHTLRQLSNIGFIFGKRLVNAIDPPPGIASNLLHRKSRIIDLEGAKSLKIVMKGQRAPLEEAEEDTAVLVAGLADINLDSCAREQLLTGRKCRGLTEAVLEQVDVGQVEGYLCLVPVDYGLEC